MPNMDFELKIIDNILIAFFILTLIFYLYNNI
jgi:hypothetical protein